MIVLVALHACPIRPWGCSEIVVVIVTIRRFEIASLNCNWSMPWNSSPHLSSFPPYIYFLFSLLLFTSSSLCFFSWFLFSIQLSTSFLFFPLYIYYLFLFIFLSYYLVSFYRSSSSTLLSILTRHVSLFVRHQNGNIVTRIRDKRIQLLNPVWFILSPQNKEHTDFAHGEIFPTPQNPSFTKYDSPWARCWKLDSSKT